MEELERYRNIVERLNATSWELMFGWDIGPILSRDGVTLRMSPKVFELTDDEIVEMAENEFARSAEVSNG